jgi:hypothetical protein
MRLKVWYECNTHLDCRKYSVEQCLAEHLVNHLHQSQGVAAQSDMLKKLEGLAHHVGGI